MAAYTFKGHDVEVLEIAGNLARISEQGIEFSVRTKQLKEKKAKASARYLTALNLDCSAAGTKEFIAYLRTPAAHCTLELEARNPDFDTPIREQYRRETGEELVEGKGYRIAPHSADKQGSEGSVRFTALAEYPPDVVELLSPDGTGHINHIGFVWLLVKEGFRVVR
jgi:hypothetical protein